MGKIIAYCREGCKYSIEASSTLTKLKNKYNIDIISVVNDENIKNNVREQLTEIIGDYNTFPIILYETSKQKLYFIGGNSDLQKLILLLDQVNSKEDIINLSISDIHKRVLYYMFKNKYNII